MFFIWLSPNAVINNPTMKPILVFRATKYYGERRASCDAIFSNGRANICLPAPATIQRVKKS